MTDDRINTFAAKFKRAYVASVATFHPTAFKSVFPSFQVVAPASVEIQSPRHVCLIHICGLARKDR